MDIKPLRVFLMVNRVAPNFPGGTSRRLSYERRLDCLSPGLLLRNPNVSVNRRVPTRHAASAIGSQATLCLEKSEQIFIDLILDGRTPALLAAAINFQGGLFVEHGRQQGRGSDRDDLIVVAMKDQ